MRKSTTSSIEERKLLKIFCQKEKNRTSSEVLFFVYKLHNTIISEESEVITVGKIIETTYHDTVGRITSFASDLLKNSFYTLNDKKPSIVTYYNINQVESTLDPGSKLAYDYIGDESPIRYNKIEDFIIYGFNRIELQLENDEFGLEAEKITGDMFILPNTIKPTEGDYFEVEHIKDSSWLFIVTDVQQDTLENGSNVYKCQYKLEVVDHDRILNNVVEDYTMIEKREGTNVVKVVETNKLEKAKEMDKVAVSLKAYFNELFYSSKVQTFIYMDLTEWRVYDEYMIEFLIRNQILANGLDSFIYVTHQLEVDKTFSLDYDGTVFRALELRDKERLRSACRCFRLEDISNIYGTIFASRYEAYFKTHYIKPAYDIIYNGAAFPDELVYDILEHNLVQDDKDLNEVTPLWRNIVVKYFYNEEYTKDEVKSILDIDFNDSIQAFYMIPTLILCLEYAIEKLLK